ncbi:enoyl-CoA hydratase-related protein [Actinophytocola sediminis]
MDDSADRAESLIDVTIDGAVGWLVLNRPDKLNAMNAAMLAQFSASLDRLNADDAVRVIVIRGAGRAFSTGYDIERRPDGANPHRDAVEDFDRLKLNIDRFRSIWDGPKPVIAAVHGYCLAGATQLCVFADITVVAEDAKIGLPKIPVGGGYITPLWTWLVGPKRAKQMAFTSGSSISGATSVDWGWANYAVPEADLWDSVTELATNIARTPAPILRMKKHSVNRIMDLQGFSASAMLGAETDALLHMDSSVKLLSTEIREHGLKAAIRAFEAGELS